MHPFSIFSNAVYTASQIITLRIQNKIVCQCAVNKYQNDLAKEFALYKRLCNYPEPFQYNFSLQKPIISKEELLGKNMANYLIENFPICLLQYQQQSCLPTCVDYFNYSEKPLHCRSYCRNDERTGLNVAVFFSHVARCTDP